MSNYTLFRIVVCRNPLHGAYYTKSTVVMKATDGVQNKGEGSKRFLQEHGKLPVPAIQ